MDESIIGILPDTPIAEIKSDRKYIKKPTNIPTDINIPERPLLGNDIEKAEPIKIIAA